VHVEACGGTMRPSGRKMALRMPPQVCSGSVTYSAGVHEPPARSLEAPTSHSRASLRDDDSSSDRPRPSYTCPTHAHLTLAYTQGGLGLAMPREFKSVIDSPSCMQDFETTHEGLMWECLKRTAAAGKIDGSY
jgi:hypothetical protein